MKTVFSLQSQLDLAGSGGSENCRFSIKFQACLLGWSLEHLLWRSSLIFDDFRLPFGLRLTHFFLPTKTVKMLICFPLGAPGGPRGGFYISLIGFGWHSEPISGVLWVDIVSISGWIWEAPSERLLQGLDFLGGHFLNPERRRLLEACLGNLSRRLHSQRT